MDHKYSTYSLLGIIALVIIVSMVEGIEGVGSVNSLAKFLGNDLIGNSSIFDDGVTVNISVPTYIQNALVTTTGSNATFNSITTTDYGIINGNLYIGGQIINVDGINATGNIIPALDSTYILGNKSYRWRNFSSVDGYFSGNVGIGTATPTGVLDVNGTVFVTGGTYNGVDNLTDSGMIIAGGKKVYFANGPSIPAGNLRNLIGTAISGGLADIDIGQTGTTLIKSINLKSGSGGNITLYSGGSETVRVTNGKVGIGTTTPAYKLDVQNAVSSGFRVMQPQYTAGVVLQSNTSTDTRAPNLEWRNSSGNYYFIMRGLATGLEMTNTTGTVEHKIGVNTQNTYFNTLGGNVGIGITAPTTRLHVNGTANITGNIQAGNYSSADGTIGYTGSCTILGLTSITVKNGLITGCV